MRRALYLGALTWLVGCGSSDHPPPQGPRNYGGETAEGGSEATAGKAGSAGRAGAAGSAGRAGSAGGPSSAGRAGSAGSAGSAGIAGIAGATSSSTTARVTVVGATSDVLIQDKVDVNCLIPEIEAATLATVELYLWQGDTKIAPTGNPVRDPTKGTTATFSLTSLTSGPVTFRCTSSGHSAQLDTYVDRGPAIKFVIPDPTAATSTTAPAPIALKQLLTVVFDVTPQPLNANDPQAAVDLSTITFSIDGNLFTVTPTTDAANRYSTAKINLTAAPFATGGFPNGSTTLKVVASNLRKATASTELKLNVDGDPPTITLIEPKSVSGNPIVSGASKLVFDVTDSKVGTSPGLGVDDESVTVTVGNKSFTYRADDVSHWTHGAISNTFTFFFTEADLAGSQSQATIVVSAADMGGNLNSGRESLVVYLDTVPPYVDLDPPTIREVYSDGTATVCSDAFDPLGEAVSDRAYLQQSKVYRAFVWDRTNDSGPGNNLTLARTDQTQVALFLQGRPQVPLLADTDNDGICDDIAPNSTMSVRLSPVVPAGTAPRYVTKTTTDPVVTNWADDTRFSYPPRTENVCALPTSTAQDMATPPTYLCSGQTEMVRVLKHTVQSAEPESAVYAVAPKSSGLDCTGAYWEFASAISDIPTTTTDGWICLAARAVDNVSNVGISRVMRVCYFNPNIGASAPKCASAEYVEDVTKTRPVPRWVPVSTSTDQDLYVSKQYDSLPDCLCDAGQNVCLPNDPAVEYYCSNKKAVCNDASKPASMITANLCNAGQTLCSPALGSRCVDSASACGSSEVAIEGDVACPVGTKRCVPSAVPSPYCAAGGYCVPLDSVCTNPADVAVKDDPHCPGKKLCLSPCTNPADVAVRDDTLCPGQELCLSANCVPLDSLCADPTDIAVSDSIHCPGRKQCVPRSADYCVNAGTTCQGTDKAIARGYQCPLDQQLCVPHDPTRPTYCVDAATKCFADQVNTTDTTTCPTNKMACTRWDGGPTYCVDKSTGSCDWDFRVAINQCPSCPPTRFDVLAKKCTGAVCQPDDTDPGCRPENTMRCPCGPLCTAESIASPPGCVPFLRYPKKDPCEQACRPPTNAFARRYVRYAQ